MARAVVTTTAGSMQQQAALEAVGSNAACGSGQNLRADGKNADGGWQVEADNQSATDAPDAVFHSTSI